MLKSFSVTAILLSVLSALATDASAAASMLTCSGIPPEETQLILDFQGKRAELTGVFSGQLSFEETWQGKDIYNIDNDAFENSSAALTGGDLYLPAGTTAMTFVVGTKIEIGADSWVYMDGSHEDGNSYGPFHNLECTVQN